MQICVLLSCFQPFTGFSWLSKQSPESFGGSQVLCGASLPASCRGPYLSPAFSRLRHLEPSRILPIWIFPCAVKSTMRHPGRWLCPRARGPHPSAQGPAVLGTQQALDKHLWQERMNERINVLPLLSSPGLPGVLGMFVFHGGLVYRFVCDVERQSREVRTRNPQSP